MRTNPYRIAAFAHVAREGSFSAAAEKLNVSQSAISQHVGKLEHALGSKLLVRDRDGFSLTSTGVEFYELADRFVTLDRLIDEKISRFSQLEDGHISVIANAPLPALQHISRFTEIYPDVNIDFTLYDWTTATSLLRQRKADIAFITEPPSSNEWVSRKVATVKYVLYVPPKHPLSKRKRISLNELWDEALLLPEKGSLTEREVTAALKKHNISIRRTIKTTTFPVMKEAIMHGVGIGIFLDGSASNDKSLVSIQIDEMDKEYETHIVIPKDKYDLRLIQNFIVSAV
jgi:DNA-binding transcriptional LysR family regulator